MKRRPVRYTLLLARSGGGSRALSLPGWALALLLGLLALWTGANLYFWHKGREARALELRLQALSQEARRLSLALEAERAKNGALSQEAERTQRELAQIRKALEELRRRAGLSPLNALPVRYGPGGQGGGAMEGWAAVRAEVLDLKNQLAEVAPALERTLEVERSRPLGLPLRAYEGITSPFGLRRNPFGPGYEFHDGLDFSAPYGTPVYATGSGVVARAGWMGPYGLAVLLDHAEGYQSLYGHLSRLLVRPGERVEKGQVLGYVGSTGRSTGPHLHYSVYRYGAPLDPRPYLSPSWASR
ncbi:MAG: peptidoglycan DD-metalloendopeptidase family protein [Thermus sp.]|uniref:M23 family metallopeptidase n=1 Tax=Thermus sp. TaxID=275 RepID=UPI0025D5033A|nr:M23 family metallopeptidase [Thermus sp.]MCS6869105.1 peptidoglycan DD-metalloendopeptidase family protein [Thermus sp.]MCS7217829.1 peptidoglycan DD-metalloendopeptidase family protein [Thermus sp.]MDW8016647.1 peptidoglycan DD-metalloendopeptidase family protein [Thermus sp.]MDW8356546.1 peptidoglycan DD-metalloendopeptidase family protein [Thermus sp.]